MYTLYLKQIREIMAQSASIATLNGVIEVRDVRIKALEKQLDAWAEKYADLKIQSDANQWAHDNMQKQLVSAKALSQRLYGNFHRDSNYG
jgi:predicted  nucleic acid-binding Zn-ribbon protein